MNKTTIEELAQGELWPMEFILSPKFTIFIDSIPDAVIISNENGNIVKCNDRACLMFRTSHAQFTKLTIEDLVPTNMRKHHVDLRRSFFEFPRSRFLQDRPTVTLRAIRGDQQLFPIESSLFAMKTDNGMLAVNIMRDISDRIDYEGELKEHAFQDALTGLPNRNYFFDVANRAFVRAKRHQDLMAVLFIDLDKFKPINDSYGHNCGDQVLVEVAKRMNKAMRAGDLIARLGGDEFVVVLFAVEDKSITQQVAARILEQCTAPYIIDGNHLTIGASIGIAYNDDFTTDAKLIVHNADLAMYQAKREGGNRFNEYQPQQDQ